MNTKDENLLVKVVKKAVGLPTGNSRCGCAPVATTANACCNTEASVSAPTSCGCAGNVDQDEECSAEAA